MGVPNKLLSESTALLYMSEKAKSSLSGVKWQHKAGMQHTEKVSISIFN